MIQSLHSYLPGPIAFNLGPIAIYWYGLILAASALAGYFLVSLRGSPPKEDDSLAVARDRLRRPGINRSGNGIASSRWTSGLAMTGDAVGSIYINLLVWGLVGARLYHVLNDWTAYWQNPFAIIKVWEGGLAIHGGIIAGAAVLFYYAKKYRLSFWALADLFSLPLILGQALGRWGNYFNQELFGRSTNLPWGIPIAPPNRPAGFEQYQYFHPTFLYEFLWDILAFVILLALARKKRRSGLVFSWYLILYGLGRVGTELLRTDAVPLVGGVRLPLLVSVAVVLAGATIFWRCILEIARTEFAPRRAKRGSNESGGQNEF